MSKLNFKIPYFLFGVIIMVALGACGEQPIRPEDDVIGKLQEKQASVAVEKVVTEPKVVEPPKEPEPPVIEIIPQQELGDSKIALEPLPAEEPEIADGKDQQIKQVEKVAEDEVVDSSKVTKAVEKAVEEEKLTPAEPVAAVPAITKKSAVVPPVVTEKEPVPAQKVEVPSDSSTFIVTVDAKVAPHPAVGKGHAMGFLINGVSGKELVLERGKTYKFDVRTDPQHDVYLSKKEIGWGSAPIAEGVTGAYTYKGEMTFTPTESTPDEVYYACRNHPYMGAVIHIVNPGEQASAKVKQKSVQAQEHSLHSGSKITEAAVKQKLMFVEMMVNAQSAKRIMASQNDEAKHLLIEAKRLLAEGREKLLAGALPEAHSLADNSLKSMSEASQLVPSGEAMVQLEETYKSLVAEIKDYKKSHKANLTRIEKTGAVPEDAKYDEQKVVNMQSEAELLASQKNYIRANAILGEVQTIITGALHKMLDSTTIVYDLNFETAADEYEYELKRFLGYEELVPIAIEAKKPAPGAIKLMESFLEKARKRRDQAVEKAASGDYPDAIAMLHQATATVRRALRMVGVMQ